jgi:hypothetical protein
MNDWRYKIRMFLTALIISFGGILPTVGCPGGCGACFQCVGLGGVMAVLAAIGTARKNNHDKAETGHRFRSGGMKKTVSGVT